MDKILVVMPVINLWDMYTIHAMESIAASVCDVPFEVLIIDNGSTDQTVEKANDFGGRKMPERVHVISNGGNKGCAASWNQGIAWGIERGFTHIVIANNDIRLGPGALKAMHARMQREPHAVLVSCVDVIKELLVPEMVCDAAQAVNHKEESEAPNPNFSCFMISKETVEKVGWFDEGFYPAYFEDNDYHYRIKLAGVLGVANTTAVFVHYGSRTQNQSSTAPVVTGAVFEKNREYFRSKWGGPPGIEQWSHPFNNEANDYTYAKRS